MPNMSVPMVICHECGGNAFLIKNKEISIILPNPGSKTIISDCYECSQCSEEIFDEPQSLQFAKQIDEIILKDKAR